MALSLAEITDGRLMNWERTTITRISGIKGTDYRESDCVLSLPCRS